MPTLTVNHLTIGKEVRIAVSLMATNRESLFTQLPLIENSSAHIIEWRLDYLLDRNDIIELLKEIKKKTTKLILVTFRREEEGGVSPISSEEYFNLLKKIINSKQADLVDIELSLGKSSIKELHHYADKTGTKLLYSAHFFSHTPSVNQMIEILKEMEELKADVTKLAVMPKNSSDVLQLLQVTDYWRNFATVPYLTISMGELGKITRYSGQVFGSCITFACIGEPSAPGQMEVETLKNVIELL